MKNLASWYGLGIVMDMHNKYLDARYYYKKAVEHEPLNSYFLNALAGAESKLGNITDAETLYVGIIEKDPLHIDTWLDYSAMLMNEGQEDQAYKIIEDAIHFYHGEADLYYRIGFYAFLQGNIAEAFNFFEKALELNFEGHTIVFEYLPELRKNEKFLYLINTYDQKNEF